MTPFILLILMILALALCESIRRLHSLRFGAGRLFSLHGGAYEKRSMHASFCG